jgi:hypothetical protein
MLALDRLDLGCRDVHAVQSRGGRHLGDQRLVQTFETGLRGPAERRRDDRHQIEVAHRPLVVPRGERPAGVQGGDRAPGREPGPEVRQRGGDVGRDQRSHSPKAYGSRVNA